MDFSMMSRRSSTFFTKLSPSSRRCHRASMNISHSPTITSPSYAVLTSTPPYRTSSTDSLARLNSAELKLNAIAALTSLYTSDEDSAIISPAITIEHDAIGEEPLSLASWSESLHTMPELSVDVQEAIVDESQRKVWVRSSVSGLSDGRTKESVDVMTFDEEGVLVSLTGEWRSFSRRDDDEESWNSEVEE